MRLVSLLALIAIVGGVGYVLVFKRDWLGAKVEEGKRLAQGFTAAKTPAEAQDQFLKAIKARDYKNAAFYCTGDYATQLTRAGDAGRELGLQIDSIMNYMENKGLKSEKAVTALYNLDPFPPYLKVRDTPKQEGDKAVGGFVLEPPSMTNANMASEVSRLDMKMFQNVLAPRAPVLAQFEMVQVGKGEDKDWKLNFPLAPGQAEAVSHFKDHYKSYVTGLDKFISEMNNGRYASKADFEKEVLQVLREAK